MANEIRYYDTPHTFISPVRHFKANDPYYFEIDNIPVKQLEESQKFLKDQVDGIISRQNNKADIEIDRSGFSELKPFATGNDRKVRVKPGKYTSRINNAYNLTPLQVVQQVAGFSNTRNANGTVSDLNTYKVETNIGDTAAAALTQFQDGLLGDALNMNGLAERAFVFPIWDDDGFHLAQGLSISGTTVPGYSQFDGDFDPDDRSLYPNFVGALLKHSTPDTTRNLVLIKNVFETGETPQAGAQGRLESEFIKRWRGAIRTSVVDVAEELEITVPDFDADDFFYIDSTGERVALNANQRIDLVFIYSKAVDEESTTIPKFDANGNPTTLTKPALGILKGAGIGVSRQTAANNNNADDRVNLQTLDGTPIMLAHPGDENGSNNGFSTSAGVIRGSFPSPDDLMNLAPVLSVQLETDAFQLIGQSILPIAYVRAQSGGGPLADVLNQDDIIDIRPFFRTTELAYNERAGIAAATPQISIANPVVTEANLEKVRKEVYGELDDRVGGIEGALIQQGLEISQVAGPGNSGARPIAAGQVLGGFWGPEGALLKTAKRQAAGGLRNATFNQIADLVEEDFGYKSGSIPYLPNWDKAEWYGKGSFAGDSVCDHINMGAALLTEAAGPDGDVKYMPPWIGGRNNGSNSTIGQIRSEQGFERFAMYNWGPGSPQQPYTTGAGRPGVIAPGESNFGTQTPNLTTLQLDSLNRRNVQVNFVRKTIKLNLDNTPWVQDYNVNVSFLNCVPLCDATNPPNSGTNQGQGQTFNRNSCQVWVEKFKDYFNICVSWAGTNHLAKTTGDILPWNQRNNPEQFAGFAHVQPLLLGGTTFARGGGGPFGYSVNYGPGASQRDDFHLQQVAVPGGGTTANTGFFNPLVPLVYPSVKFEVIGIAGDFLTESLGGNGAKMRNKNPVINCT
jgi:hypothetical protein